MAVCLKCGFDLVGNESECPSCGVIIAKARTALPRPTAAAEEPTNKSRAHHAVVKVDLKGNATKQRLFATMIDNTVAILGCLWVASILPPEFSAAFRGVAATLLYLAYFFVQEGSWATTLGKRAFGLQVARLDGERAGWTEAWWRTLLRILEVNPFLLGAIPGGLAIAGSRRKQRLGDMMARTVVVNKNALASEQAQIKAACGG